MYNRWIDEEDDNSDPQHVWLIEAFSNVGYNSFNFDNKNFKFYNIWLKKDIFGGNVLKNASINSKISKKK